MIYADCHKTSHNQVSQQVSKPIADELYKTRLSQWVVTELMKPGMSDRTLAEKLGAVGYGAIQRWRGLKGGIKGQLTQESIQAIADYRGMTSAEVKAWLEGKEPIEVQSSLVEKVSVLQQRVTDLEQLLLRVIETMPAPKSISDLLRHWMLREGVSQLEFEMQVLSRFPRITPERLRQLQEGLPPGEITNNDLGAIGSVVRKADGTMYNLLELQAIRDQSPASILSTLDENGDSCSEPSLK